MKGYLIEEFDVIVTHYKKEESVVYSGTVL